MRYEEIVKVLLNEYDKAARQLAAQSDSEGLIFDQSMIERVSKTLGTEFTSVLDKINVLTAQVSLEIRSADYKKRFLRKAVLYAKWTFTTIAQISTACFRFKGFFIVLREHIQLEGERHVTMSNTTGTYFGQYGVHPKSLQYRSRGHRPQHSGKRKLVEKDERCMSCRTYHGLASSEKA